jgi:hypothetical protein
MKKVCLALLLGVSIGGYSKTVSTYENCDKTYTTPFHVSLHGNKIEIENSGEIFQTSAVFSDDSGLYYTNYLKTVEVEEPTVIDLSPLLNEDHFTTDVQLEPLEEVEVKVEIGTKAPRIVADPQPQKAVSATIEQKQVKSWPYSAKHHR